MDKRTHDVEEDLKHILHIRMSLGHKIDLLEKRVEETVQGTKAVALAALDFARIKAVDFIESAARQLNRTDRCSTGSLYVLHGSGTASRPPVFRPF